MIMPAAMAPRYDFSSDHGGVLVLGKDGKAGAQLYRYRFGAAEFDEARLELHVGGLIVELEQKPQQVLLELLAQADQVVTRQELFKSVWEGRPTVDQVLNNAIAKVRKALGDSAGESVVTVPRVGYKLVGPVQRTTIGRRLQSQLDLLAGQSVPGRDAFLLTSQIATTRGSEVWLAHHSKSREPRVYKFGTDRERLAALKREATLNRVIQESLPDRRDIVRILDWNFEAPPFFLECEYGGENLSCWAATQNRLAAMSMAERIALFLPIADAMAAAHSVGVLHKDLKPANILVAQEPSGHWHLRVADFGSGRLLEPNRLDELNITQIGVGGTENVVLDSASGTPMYIAPELLAGAMPTVQSDVYALGLVLYQIIVGDLRRPMAPGWELAVDDEFVREDIAAATDGEPTRRLTSIAELAMRLRGLTARRDERAQSRDAESRLAAAKLGAQRMRARRPWMVALVGSLSLGLFFSIWSINAQRRALTEVQREKSRNEQINRFLTDDLLGAADPSGPGGAHNPTMRDILTATAARLDTKFLNDPETKASIYQALGSAYFGMTEYKSAEQYRRAALELLAVARGSNDPETLKAEYELISVLVQTNRLDDAEKMLSEIDQRAAGQLSAVSPLALAAHWTHAGYFKLRMAPEKALEEYRAADQVRAKLDPGNDSLMFRLRDALSWCYSRLNRNDQAVDVLREVMTPEYSPQRVGPLFWGQARIDYGIALKVLEKNKEAETVMNGALSELRQSLGADHFFVAVVQNELGDLYVREQRWPEAIASLTEAYEIMRKRAGEHGQSTLIVGANLGIVEYRTGKSLQAAQVLNSAHDDLARQLGVASPQAESIAFYLASALADLRRYTDAASLLPPLNPADLTAAEPREDWAPRLAALRAQVMIGQGQKSEGLGKLKDAIEGMQRAHTPAEDIAPYRKVVAQSEMLNH